MKRKLAILAILTIIFLIIANIGLYLLSRPSVQTYLVQKAVGIIETRTGAEAKIESVNFRLPFKLILNNVYIGDLNNDTLLYVNRLRVNIGMRSLLYRKLYVKGLELNETKVYLHRAEGDSLFNFEILTGKNAQAKKSTGEIKPFRMSLPEAEIKKIDFHLLDKLNNTEFKIAFDHLAVKKAEINSGEKTMYLQKFKLEGADILYKKLLETECREVISGQQKALSMLNNAGWHLTSEHIIINHSTFSNINENKFGHQGGINFNDLFVHDIHLVLEKTEIVCDTIFSKITSLSAKEKSGFLIKSMTADARVATDGFECENLHLVTGNSVIKDYLAFEYDRFNDFNDFVNSVTMIGDFKKSKVAMKDINFFAKNALDNIAHNTLSLTGTIRGTVNNLRGRNLDITLGKETRFQGNLSLRGLPVFKETFISLSIDNIRTTVTDLSYIYPHLTYPGNLNHLGAMNFSGEFTGFTNDFVAYGNLNSAIGTLRSDINFKIDPDNNTAMYSGNLSASRFHLGKYFEEEELFGEVSLNAKINGKGLQLQTLDAKVVGDVSSFHFRQHNYDDVKVNGEVKNRFFKGALVVRDANLDLDFEGKIDMTDSIPVFQFEADLRKANLKPLNLSKVDYSISSFLQLDFAGLEPDNFMGYAGLFNTQVEKNGEHFELDTFMLKALPLGGKGKLITLRSDVLDGNIIGSFSYQTLPSSMLNAVRHYFKTGTQPLKEETEEQNFDFDFTVKDTRNLTKLIDTSFTNISRGFTKGKFNNINYLMDIEGFVDSIKYDKIQLKGITLKTQSDAQNFSLAASIDSFLHKENFITERILLDSRIKSDSISFTLKAQPDDAPNRMELNGQVFTDFKSVALQLLPSSIFLNNEEWVISDGNQIYYEKDKLMVEKLILTNDAGQLEFKTFMDAFGGNHLSVFFRDFNLHSVSRAFMPASKIKVDGKINGSATILNVLKKQVLLASMFVDSFKVNNHTLGNIILTTNFKPGAESADINMSLMGESNNIKVKGEYFMDKRKDNLNLDFDITNLHLPHVEPFIQKEISRVEGDLNGKLQFSGSLDNPLITGSLFGKKVQAKINYLNTIYSFDEGKFTFSRGLIDFGKLQLRDEERNSANATGNITYSNFKDFAIDVKVETDNFMFMNTSHASSEPFYGRLFAKGIALIRGPLKLVEFYISGKTQPNTIASVNITDSKDVAQYSFYRFINPNVKETVKQRYVTKSSGIILNIDVEVTPDATVSLILDNEGGDVIRTQAEGNLKVMLNHLGELSIIGNYRIVDGNYLFTMQNIISKRFNIEKGSNIVWNGNPDNAVLDIKAVYKLRASPHDLIEDIVTGDNELQRAKNRVPVFLYLLISGSLSNPEIRFDIKVPDADPAIRTALESKFQELNFNPNEFNRQVVGLLVLNRFLPQRTGTGEPNVASDVNNSVSEFISNQLSMYLSDWVSDFITDVQFNINYRSYRSDINGGNTGSGEPIDFQNRQELQLALTKTFYNDRILIDVGGNFDFGDIQSADSDRASNIAGDFEIQYSITPDGRLRAKGFRKGKYDMFQDRNRNKTGVGISYQREFNNVKDLFPNIRRSLDERNRRKDEKNESPGDDSTPLDKAKGTEEE